LRYDGFHTVSSVFLLVLNYFPFLGGKRCEQHRAQR
jgi:hypothetical protein